MGCSCKAVVGMINSSQSLKVKRNSCSLLCLSYGTSNILYIIILYIIFILYIIIIIIIVFIFHLLIIFLG